MTSVVCLSFGSQIQAMEGKEKQQVDALVKEAQRAYAMGVPSPNFMGIVCNRSQAIATSLRTKPENYDYRTLDEGTSHFEIGKPVYGYVQGYESQTGTEWKKYSLTSCEAYFATMVAIQNSDVLKKQIANADLNTLIDGVSENAKGNLVHAYVSGNLGELPKSE